MLLAMVTLSLTAACGRAPADPNARLQRGALAGSNVLLVTIDTLRADRVGAHSGTTLTPALDQLASRGVRFTQAHAHAPMTLPAHTSILSGLVPATHGVHNNASTILAPGTPTFASIFHEAGYRTGAFVGAFVLDARFGLSRGFDTYDDRVGADTGPITFAFAERTADRVTALAADWILNGGPGLEAGSPPPVGADLRVGPGADTQVRPYQPVTKPAQPPARRPWFCWIHLFDPHAPYRAPETRVADPYDNEIAFTDAQLGRFLERLRIAGQLDSTLVVVLADHGESLGEHGEATHGLFAYEATLRIPLIIAGPSIRAAISGAPVAQADLLPTVLDLLGIGAPSRLDGRSLLPVIRGETAPAPPIYFEALDAYLTRNWAPLTGILLDGWKYIDLPDAELYDLSHDPGELRNRSREDQARMAALSRRLAEWPVLSSAHARSRAAPIDPDAAARLRALGYTASQAPEPRRDRYTSADDPKRLLDLDRRYERALTLTGERRFAEAAALLQGVVADRPDFTGAYLNLASVFIAAGEPRQAVALLVNAAKRGVTSPELQARAGAAYLASGDAERARATLEAVARPDAPGGLDAMNTLGVALTQQGHYDRARRLFADVLARSPRSATTWSNLGLTELADHRAADASRAFEHAVEADPHFGQAWEGLGAARAPSDPPGAIDAWKRALEVEPRNYDLLFNLAVTLRDQHRATEARPYLERFVREAPPERYARDIATFRAWLAQ